MALFADANFTGAMACFHTWNEERAQEIMTNEDVLDFLNKEVTARLVEVKGLELSERDTRLVGSMFHVINDMERVGDHSVNVLDAARLKEQENVKFTEPPGSWRTSPPRWRASCKRPLRSSAPSGIPPRSWKRWSRWRRRSTRPPKPCATHHVDRLKNKKCSARNGMLYLDMLATWSVSATTRRTSPLPWTRKPRLPRAVNAKDKEKRRKAPWRKSLRLPSTMTC